MSRGLGNIYLIQSLQLGWIKIGWARDIAARMVGLASEHGTDLTLLGSFEGTMQDESALQRRFAHRQIGYDWFEPADDLIRFAGGLPPRIQISFVGAPSDRGLVFLKGRVARWANRQPQAAARAAAARTRFA